MFTVPLHYYTLLLHSLEYKPTFLPSRYSRRAEAGMKMMMYQHTVEGKIMITRRRGLEWLTMILGPRRMGKTTPRQRF